MFVPFRKNLICRVSNTCHTQSSTIPHIEPHIRTKIRMHQFAQDTHIFDYDARLPHFCAEDSLFVVKNDRL